VLVIITFIEQREPQVLGFSVHLMFNRYNKLMGYTKLEEGACSWIPQGGDDHGL